MPVVRVWQPHTDDMFARWVQDAASIVGERIAYCEMWNTQNADGVPRCEHCYDDVYGQSDTTGGICKWCYGTTFTGGIKAVHFTNAIIGSPNTTSLYDKAKGEFDMADMVCQVSDDVLPHEKDYLLRIAGWHLLDEDARLSVKLASYMDVQEFANYGSPYKSGLEAVHTESYMVKRSFNDGYLKDGFRHLGQSHRLGAQVPVSLTDQSNPISSLVLSDISAPVVSDNQPFVAYSPYCKDVPDGIAMTVGWMSNYKASAFK